MNTASENKRILNLTLEAAIRISLVAGLAYMCIRIVAPFALLVLWASILAIALWPLCRRLTAALGGRNKLAAALIALLFVAMLLVPGWLLSIALVCLLCTLALALRKAWELWLRVAPG